VQWTCFEQALQDIEILLRDEKTSALVFLDYMNERWKTRAEMWAAWGRLNASWHGHDTTNLIENYFNQQKYAMIPRSRIPCGTNHAEYLVNTVVPYFAQRRYDLLAGLVDNQRMRDTSAINSTKQRLLQNQGPARLDWVHQKCGMGTATVDNATHYFCLGDLSYAHAERPHRGGCASILRPPQSISGRM